MGPYRPISPKTPAVSNCYVLYLIVCNGQHKTFIKFIYIQKRIREKYLITLFIQYGYEYLSTKYHKKSAGRVGVMVESQSTDREVGSSIVITI